MRYRNLNSTYSSVCLCFLDASKAFDRVNNEKLFVKLADRGIPGYLLRVLAYWYTQQTMLVRWGDVYSDSFHVGNGQTGRDIITFSL